MTPEQADNLSKTSQAVEDHNRRLTKIETKQGEIQDTVNDIHTVIVRQKGFIGGVLWLWSFLSAGALAAWGLMKDGN